MKSNKVVYLLALASLFYSCSLDDDSNTISEPIGPWIGLSNWTGHWDAICSPGQTLVFSVTAHSNTQTFEIPFDSGATYREAKLKEGDLIRVVIMDKNRNVIHSRSKNFYPSNPERPAPGLKGAPIIQVCDVGRLDLLGF